MSESNTMNKREPVPRAFDRNEKLLEEIDGGGQSGFE
jgi:hypothetical protein